MAKTSGPCQSGMTANVARPSAASFPATPVGRGGGGGRGGAAKSDVGEPGEGGVTIKAAAAAAEAAAARGRGGAPAAPGGPGRGPRKPDFLSAISSDGMYHAVYISNGEEPGPPITFLPANANARQLTIINDGVYAATSRGCGGAPNGVWALDIPTKEVKHWTPPAGDIAGEGSHSDPMRRFTQLRPAVTWLPSIPRNWRRRAFTEPVTRHLARRPWSSNIRPRQ